MFHVCIAHCMRKSTKCQNVAILVSACGALCRFMPGSEVGYTQSCLLSEPG